jgi:DDE family transposase
MEKKQPVGDYYQEGRGYCTEALQVNDHDFTSSAEGIVNPYGIYDIKRNEGYMILGTSKDTSEFACDCIKDWWERYGKQIYPGATSILILADGGGSNSSRHYIFKEDLQKLSNDIGIEIRIAGFTSIYVKIQSNRTQNVLSCNQSLWKSGVYQFRDGKGTYGESFYIYWT